MSNGNVEQVIARRTPEAARSTDELYIGDLPSDIERFTLTAILELNGKLARFVDTHFGCNVVQLT